MYATFFYAISVYGGIFLSTERGVPLIKIQTRIMKNLFAKFYPNESCLFKKLEILKMPDVYRLRVSVLMYKMLIKNELPLLRENINIHTARHEYETSRDVVWVSWGGANAPPKDSLGGG